MKPIPKKNRIKKSGKALQDLYEKVFIRDSYQCVICGSYFIRDNPHHINFRSELGNDEEKNLATLCGSCHDAIHHGTMKDCISLFKRAIEHWGIKSVIKFLLQGIIERIYNNGT